MLAIAIVFRVAGLIAMTASTKGGCRQPPDCLGIRSFSA
jgi:hypothetical protein